MTSLQYWQKTLLALASDLYFLSIWALKSSASCLLNSLTSLRTDSKILTFVAVGTLVSDCATSFVAARSDSVHSQDSSAVHSTQYNIQVRRKAVEHLFPFPVIQEVEKSIKIHHMGVMVRNKVARFYGATLFWTTTPYASLWSFFFTSCIKGNKCECSTEE